MPYLDLKTKLEPSRAIKNKLLQLGVYSCFVMVFLFMLGIFSATVYQGIGAFKTTKIYLTIDHVQGRSVRSNLIQALYKEFPSYSLRQEKKQIRKLVSDNAYYTLKLKPGVHTYAVTASSIVNLYMQGVYKETQKESMRKISNFQIALVKQLQNEAKLKRAFNTAFFAHADSRDPSHAGILGAFVGTLLTLLITIAFAVPLGVACALWMEELPPKTNLSRWLHHVLEININNLEAVPSIVYGLLGLSFLLHFVGVPRSTPLAGGLTLGLLTLPTIVIVTRTALRAIPNSIREASLSLGLSPIQTILYQVLPCAIPGIVTGSIIGLARSIGETAPLLMIGMVAFITSVPTGFTSMATTLPVQIYLWADSPELGFYEKTSAAIIITMLLLIVFKVIAAFIRRRYQIKWQ